LNNQANMLINFFDKDLTSDQKLAVSSLQAFLEDSSSCFLLKGYAGTGKTFLMGGVVKYLNAKERYFQLMAPTGRAAKILTQKTGCRASTIHRNIYSLNYLKEIPDDEKDEREGFKFYYELKLNQDPANTVYIIDEASMVSNVYDEAEFFRFGSGHLLDDLFQYINTSGGLKHKIIFIGDKAQLPPVRSNISPSLSKEYLYENFNITAREYELTQIVRQESESGILNNATRIREAIRQDIYNHFEIITSTPDVVSIKPENILSGYLETSKNKITGTTMIIAYSNRVVYDYNLIIRQHFFPDQVEIAPGDKILLVQNNYTYEIDLFNGDFGKIIFVSDRSETKIINVSKDNKITLAFRDVIIRFWDINNRPFDIKCKIIENLLNSKERELSSDETKALYIDFKIRHNKLAPETKEFKDALKSDLYFNALHIKYGYAITCHKAQGGEWSNVFVDFNISSSKLNEMYFRWVYTAITRASKQLYLVNEPYFDIFSQLSEIKTVSPKQINKVFITESTSSENILFEFPEDNSFLKLIYISITQTLKGMDIQINQIEHRQYCERYYFSKDDQYLWFNIWYNSHENITKLEAQPWINNISLKDILASLLEQLKGKVFINPTLNSTSFNQLEIDFPEDKPFLRELFSSINQKLIDQNIVVSGVTHHTFMERYFFKKDEFIAQVDIYYNGKGQFTKYLPVPLKSTSPELLAQVIQLIKKVY
jgi:hypothetical protein